MAPAAENVIPVSLPELPEGERNCPEAVNHQLQLFFEMVSPLQRRTRSCTAERSAFSAIT